MAAAAGTDLRGVGAGLPGLRRQVRGDRPDPAGRSGLPGDQARWPGNAITFYQPMWMVRFTPTTGPESGVRARTARSSTSRTGVRESRARARSRPAGAVDGRVPGRTDAGSGIGSGGRWSQVLPAWVVARASCWWRWSSPTAACRHCAPGQPGRALRVHQGLLVLGRRLVPVDRRPRLRGLRLQSVRFFPGFPMVARVLGWHPGVSGWDRPHRGGQPGALAAMAGLVVLVRRDLGDAALARRSVWLLALAPPAYSLVLGYADRCSSFCAVVTLLAARTGRWWWAAGAGWPPGWSGRWASCWWCPWWSRCGEESATRAAPGTNAPASTTSTARGRWADVVAVAALVAPWPAPGGTWPGSAPSSVTPGCRSGSSRRTGTAARHRAVRRHVAQPRLRRSTATTWAAPSTSPGWCCAWLCWWWPSGGCRSRYAAFATAVLAVSLTTSNLDSFERYALGAFPLVIAASTLTARRGVEIGRAGPGRRGHGRLYLAALFGLVVP